MGHTVKGDVYRCPKCGSTIKEGDCSYTEAICRRTTACRSKGGMRMVKEARRG